jgi:cystathionine beta-lyase
MISFDVGTRDAVAHILKTVQLWMFAESLGGVKSLICLPCEMTHKSIPSDIRYQSGITDSLIRLSVGLEDVEDLIEDLKSTITTCVNQLTTISKN